MKTRVVNIKHQNQVESGEKLAYIGRPSIFGNPFKIGVNGNRQEIIIAYREYLRQHKEANTDLWQEILKLKGKVLGCYCKPLACHGDIIVEFLENSSESTHLEGE